MSTPTLAVGRPEAVPSRWRSLATAFMSSPSLQMVGRRLLVAIPVLFGVTLLTFVVMNLLPGDAAQELLGANATPQQVHELEIKLHLDQPPWVRYAEWLRGVVTGNLGTSLASKQEVTTVLGQRLPVTFELVLYGLLISVVFAVPLAVLTAWRPGGIFDRLCTVLSVAGLSVAPYVLALVLIYVFAVKLGVLPAIGYVSPTESIVGNIRSLTLPAVALGLPLLCFYMRLLRADLLEQMQSEDYVVTARAKGLPPWRVLVGHALRNSLFGFLTVVGLNLGTLIGATVLVEQIFSLPGMGQELLEAIDNRDIPVIEGTVLVFALIVVLVNLLTDLLYAVLDPRIRYGRSAA
ncbi:MAG TPA: ABC transporter permease [Candidatus Dormibacteraeota bacterium]|nr:ABC transporter permease [Candidatus Dormibacteraeota bacterium]